MHNEQKLDCIEFTHNYDKRRIHYKDKKEKDKILVLLKKCDMYNISFPHSNNSGVEFSLDETELKELNNNNLSIKHLHKASQSLLAEFDKLKEKESKLLQQIQELNDSIDRQTDLIRSKILEKSKVVHTAPEYTCRCGMKYQGFLNPHERDDSMGVVTYTCESKRKITTTVEYL
jgi:hypothetical protein